MTIENLARLLDALQCGALLVDRAGLIAHVNRRLCEMMQRRCRDLIGHTLLELYPTGEGRVAIQDSLDHFDESREYEFFLPHSDGTRLPVIVSGRPLEDPLSDYRIVTIIDLSMQKRAEMALEEQYQDVTRLSDTILEQALALKRYSEDLEDRVRERTLDLHEANMESIFMLAVASEAKDADTGAHVRRIEHYTRLLARELGLNDDEVERIAYSSILHDVGKIHVPDDILRKPAALSDAEWQIMRQHTLAGERILSRQPFFDVARGIARSHHENWDGSGYPDGLTSTSIPLPARIVRVADVYDALTSARPYKAPWPVEQAVAEIEHGSSFDPDVVRAFQLLHRSGRFNGSG